MTRCSCVAIALPIVPVALAAVVLVALRAGIGVLLREDWEATDVD